MLIDNADKHLAGLYVSVCLFWCQDCAFFHCRVDMSRSSADDQDKAMRALEQQCANGSSPRDAHMEALNIIIPGPSFDSQDRIDQANLAREPSNNQRKIRIKFKEDLVDLVAPPDPDDDDHKPMVLIESGGKFELVSELVKCEFAISFPHFGLYLHYYNIVCLNSDITKYYKDI